MALQSIKGAVTSLKQEAEDYDMQFHRSYVKSIIDKCNSTIKELQS